MTSKLAVSPVPDLSAASDTVLPLLFGVLLALGACAPAATSTGGAVGVQTAAPPSDRPAPPSPDPRIGLGAGLLDAEQAIWNLRLVSATPPPPEFVGSTNSDLAFIDNYAIQGNYNGFQIWDISNPERPELVNGYVCPASQ